MNYIIADTEYTTWPGALESGWSAPGQHREIVQMGAILVDDSFVELQSFAELVIPKINPVLSELFQQLTGVTQLKLDQYGIPFPEALQRFIKFCGRDAKIICMNGDSGVFRENCEINSLAFPFQNDFYRLRPFLERNGIDLSATSSGDLHKLTSRPLIGHTHDAIHDCRSMARWLECAHAERAFTSVDLLPTEIPRVDPRSNIRHLEP